MPVRRARLLALVCTGGALLAAGCGRSQGLSDVLPRTSHLPGASYSEAAMHSCLSARHVFAAAMRLDHLRAGPVGMTGHLLIVNGGRATTPLGKAMGSPSDPSMQEKLGIAPFNSGSLFFFRSARDALVDERAVVEQELFRAGAPAALKSMLNDLYGGPPPLSAIPQLVRVEGNVLVVWDYPRAYPERSARVLASCFRTSRA